MSEALWRDGASSQTQRCSSGVLNSGTTLANRHGNKVVSTILGTGVIGLALDHVWADILIGVRHHLKVQNLQDV